MSRLRMCVAFLMSSSSLTAPYMYMYVLCATHTAIICARIAHTYMHTHDTTQAAQVFLIPFIYPALNKHDPDCVKQQMFS